MKIIKVVLLTIVIAKSVDLFSPGGNPEEAALLGLEQELNNISEQVGRVADYKEKIKILQPAIEEAYREYNFPKINKMYTMICEIKINRIRAISIRTHEEEAERLVMEASVTEDVFQKIVTLLEAWGIQEAAGEEIVIGAAFKAKKELAKILPQAGFIIQEQLIKIASKSESFEKIKQTHNNAEIVAKAVETLFEMDRRNFYKFQNEAWKKRYNGIPASATIRDWHRDWRRDLRTQNTQSVNLKAIRQKALNLLSETLDLLCTDRSLGNLKEEDMLVEIEARRAIEEKEVTARRAKILRTFGQEPQRRQPQNANPETTRQHQPAATETAVRPPTDAPQSTTSGANPAAPAADGQDANQSATRGSGSAANVSTNAKVGAVMLIIGTVIYQLYKCQPWRQLQKIFDALRPTAPRTTSVASTNPYRQQNPREINRQTNG